MEEATKQFETMKTVILVIMGVMGVMVLISRIIGALFIDNQKFRNEQ